MKRAVWPGLLGLAIGLILCLSGPAWALGLDPAKAWTETESTGRVRLLYLKKK